MKRPRIGPVQYIVREVIDGGLEVLAGVADRPRGPVPPPEDEGGQGVEADRRRAA